MLRRGRQILLAAPKLKQIQHAILKELRRGPARERSVIQAAPQARRHHRARERVVHREPDEARGPEPGNPRPIFGEMFPRQFEMNQRRFDLGTGEPVVDSVHDAAEIQKPGNAIAIRDQPLQPAPQLGCAGEIRFALAGPQEKNGGLIRNRFYCGGKRRRRLTHRHVCLSNALSQRQRYHALHSVAPL
jgi:hypothetical protein